MLIFSRVYQCNCTITEISIKRTTLRYLYSPPGRTERQRPAYCDFSNAIVCLSYSQHPVMAEEKRSQERGSVRETTQGEREKRLWSAFLSPLGLSPSHIVATLSHRIANPRSAVRQIALSVACYHNKNIKHFHQAENKNNITQNQTREVLLYKGQH